MAISDKKIRNIIVLFLITLSILCILFVITRFSTRFMTALPHWPVQCPINTPAILVIGQSQASNTGEERRIPKINRNSYSFKENSCYMLRDPMPGTGGLSGSLWPSFVDYLNTPIVIANISVSGSSIEDWTTIESINKIKFILDDMHNSGYRNPIILWMQGETNGGLKTSRDIYYSELKKLISIAPKNRWVLTRESICYNVQVKWLPLDEARNDIIKHYSNVVIGPDVDKIPLSMRLADKCHLRKSGQDWLASRLSATIRRLIK